MLSPSTILRGRWKIIQKIGQGAFGETYSGYDVVGHEEVAVKVEVNEKKKLVLKLEVAAIRRLQDCRHVCRYIHSGKHDSMNYVVMERLGVNLADLRKHMPTQQFSLPTTLMLGLQMIESLEEVHRSGYIHRDIKPSNFMMGRGTAEQSRKLYLIDFGLARRHILSGGKIRRPRKYAGFRGTARYASPHSHASMELSRRDDLWSLLYMMVEFLTGYLPWRKIKDKALIGQMKEEYSNGVLTNKLPEEFSQFLRHIKSLDYETAPDYEYLTSLLKTCMERHGYSMTMPFDWEYGGHSIDERENARREGGGVEGDGDVPMGGVPAEYFIPPPAEYEKAVNPDEYILPDVRPAPPRGPAPSRRTPRSMSFRGHQDGGDQPGDFDRSPEAGGVGSDRGRHRRIPSALEDSVHGSFGTPHPHHSRRGVSSGASIEEGASPSASRTPAFSRMNFGGTGSRRLVNVSVDDFEVDFRMRNAYKQGSDGIRRSVDPGGVEDIEDDDPDFEELGEDDPFAEETPGGHSLEMSPAAETARRPPFDAELEMMDDDDVDDGSMPVAMEEDEGDVVVNHHPYEMQGRHEDMEEAGMRGRGRGRGRREPRNEKKRGRDGSPSDGAMDDPEERHANSRLKKKKTCCMVQ